MYQEYTFKKEHIHQLFIDKYGSTQSVYRQTEKQANAHGVFNIAPKHCLRRV